MTEDALLGTACFCVPRRLFVVLVAAAWCFWNMGSVFNYMIYYPLEGGAMEASAERKACTTHKCLEVFTCDGLQDTTRHIREPFLLLGGLIFGAFGLHGAVGVNHNHLKYFAYFLLAVSAMYILNLVFDGLFLSYCQHYPSNVIYTMVLSTPVSGLKDLPVSEEKKATLANMDKFPRHLVNWMVYPNFWRWYFLFAVVYAIFVLYCSHVTRILSRTYIDGPVGLGVNYRLGAWRNEVLLKHRIEEMEEELVFGIQKDLGVNAEPPRKKVEHLAAEGRHNYGAV